LTLAELLWRHREAVRTGWLLYRADNPARVEFTTDAPRVILQCIFFTLAGRLVSGPSGAAYAFAGCVAYAACTRTIIYCCDVPMTDKWAQTYYRLQVGAVRPWAVYLCRALPYAVSGILSSALVLAVGGPILGLSHESVRLLPLLPVYALTACTTTAFGLAVAGLAVGRSADVLLGNLAAYFLLATAGVVAPVTAGTRWLADLGYLFPLQHGLIAIHAQLAGRPWGGQVALEAGLGACWTGIAVLVMRTRDAAAFRGGSEAA
jgi:ABC-2 type transporter